MTTVIGYCTEKQAYYDLFMESCRRNNITPVMLGLGEKWVGFGKKTTDIREYIKGLPENEIVISVDPYDVVFLSGLDEIEKKFNGCRSPYLCGAMKLGPILGRVYNKEFNKTGKPTPKTSTSYEYANTGTWISRAGYAIDLINRLENEYGMTEKDMDQEIITGIYIDNRTIADIDWNCEIFHNLLFSNFITRKPDLKDLEFRDGRIFNSATGTYPCILHASGNAVMEKIGVNLGYDSKFSIPVNNNKNFFKKVLFHIRKLSWIILFFLLSAGIIISGTVYFINSRN